MATRLLRKALSENSLQGLKDALTRQREVNEKEYPNFVQSALKRALSNNVPGFVAYLLENEFSHIKLDDLTLLTSLWTTASIPILELLLAHGWDINQQSPKTTDFEGSRLIDSGHVLENYELVVWMVEHGAIVDDGDPDAETSYPRPLLETCAAHGTLKSFNFLREKGAKLGRRTLHRTCLVAAELGADPSSITDATLFDADQGPFEGEVRKREVEAMLRYLVNELKLDLDQIQVYVPWCTGPPIFFAAREQSGAGVVRWLLDKGADPTVTCPGLDRDISYWTSTSGNAEAERLVKEWKGKRESPQC